MKFKTGMDALIASLTFALIIGAVATAQQQTEQQQGQTQQKKQDASTTPDRPTNQTDTTRGTDKDRDVGAYSRQGMYDEYRRHWDARFHDPAFVTYHDKQLERFNANRVKNQAQKDATRDAADAARDAANTARTTTDRSSAGAGVSRQPRSSTSYEQYSQNSNLWTNRNASVNAWQRSDAYWRMSDRYWRDPSRRQSDGFNDYWTRSEAYWNDSDQYWDMYFNDFDNNDTIDKDRIDDRERTNR